MTSTTSSKDAISAVNSVISICKDAEEGFEGAAKAVEDPQLKSLFNQLASQRRQFASELQQVVRTSGENPATPEGVAGKMHASWMALKGAVTGHSAHQILEETERGEDMSMERYRDALSKDLPGDIRSVIERQFEQVRNAHSQIRTLRDSTKKQ